VSFPASTYTFELYNMNIKDQPKEFEYFTLSTSSID